MLHDFANQLKQKQATIDQETADKELMQEEFKAQIAVINDQFTKINQQALQDA